MKKLLLGAVCAMFCTTALVQSCQQSQSKLQVYKVKSIRNGKMIAVIEGESVVMQVRVGDTVFVSLNDSEITDHLKEIRASYKNPANMHVDSARLFIVKSSYTINK